MEFLRKLDPIATNLVAEPAARAWGHDDKKSLAPAAPESQTSITQRVEEERRRRQGAGGRSSTIRNNLGQSSVSAATLLG